MHPHSLPHVLSPTLPHTLIDLYVPAPAATPDEAAEAAGRAGLDAIVWVVDGPDELPDPSDLAAGAAGEDDDGGDPPRRARIHPACVALGPGYRFLVLLPDWRQADVFAALEVLTSPEAIQDTVRQAGGVAVPVAPRQAPDGEVMREKPVLSAAHRTGVVAQIAGGSHLGRDLDLEDAGAADRRILGASGPFAAFEDLGRFASLVPGDPDDPASWIASLSQGHGVAIELSRPVERRQGGKRRRRRGRGGRRGGEGGGGGERGPDGG